MLARARRRARARVRLRRRAPAVRGAASPRRARRALAGAAAPAAAVFEARAAADAEGGASFAALHGLYWLTLNLAAERPLLLAVDDLHWCDRPSLRFLAYLARRLDGAAGARRRRRCAPASRGTDPALLGEIVQRPRDAAAAARAAERRRRSPRSCASGSAPTPTPAFCAACHDATGGNPLLLRQLLRALEAEGVAPDAGQRRRRARDRPARGVEHRAAAARAAARRRRARSRAPSPCSARAPTLPPVAALAGSTSARSAAATGELVRAEILRPDPPLGFVHPLVRDAVYHELPPAERELEHERAARRAARRGRRRPSRSRRSCCVAPRRGAPWVAELLRARPARAAMRTGAADSAVAYLRRALEEPPPAERRTASCSRSATAEALTSGPAAAEHLQEAYDALDDPRRARRGSPTLLFRALLFTGAPGRGRRGRASAPAAALAAGARRPAPRRSRRCAGDVLLRRRRASCSPRDGRATGTPPAEPGAGREGARGVAALRLGQPRRHGRRVRRARARRARGRRAARDRQRPDRDHRRRSRSCSPTAPRRSSRSSRCEAGAHRRGSLLDICSVHLWQRLHALAPRASSTRPPSSCARRSTASAIYGLGRGRRARTPTRSSARCCVERGDLAGARRGARAQRRPGRRVRRRALLAARASWRCCSPRARCEEALGARRERFARALRAPTATRRVAVARCCRAEALDRLGRTRRGARARARASSTSRARFGAPGAVGRALRVLGRLERDAGLARLEEAVAVLDGSLARLEHAKALRGARLGAAPRAAAGRRARAAAPGARAGGRLRRAGAGRARAHRALRRRRAAAHRRARRARRADGVRAPRRRPRRRRARPTATSRRRST